MSRRTEQVLAIKQSSEKDKLASRTRCFLRARPYMLSLPFEIKISFVRINLPTPALKKTEETRNFFSAMANSCNDVT